MKIMLSSGEEISVEKHIIKEDGKWIFAPIEFILHPKNGYRCIGPCWWVVTPRNEVIFFESYNFPQCSYNENISKSLIKRSIIPQGSEIRFIEMAFVPDLGLAAEIKCLVQKKSFFD